jgi:hypothetical protein
MVVHDALRLRHDPVIRCIIGGKTTKGSGASPSQMGRFETNWLKRPENLATLADLSGRWIDHVAKRRRRGRVVLDMDSVSPTHGDQEKRPVGRPAHYAQRFYESFRYKAASWTHPRRVVAKIEWHHGELFPRVGFIVTNLRLKSRNVVEFYNKRGTCEQWIKEGKNAIKWTRLSCRSFDANAVRLQLHAGDKRREICVPTSAEAPFSPPDRAEMCSSG